MSRFPYILSSFLLLALLPSPSLAGWGSGDCGPVGLPVINAQPLNVYSWKQSTDPDAWELRLNGSLVGGYRQSTGLFFPLVGNSWGSPSACPVEFPVKPSAKETKKEKKSADCPCCGEDCKCAAGKHCGKNNCPCVLPGAVAESDGVLNFGLDRREIGRKPRRTHNGREVDRETLLDVISKASIPDDANQLAVTVIGTEAERQRVLSDLKSLTTANKIKLKAYDPSDWAVADSGFVTTGHPTIYCQSPSGKVLHRQDSYAGPDALAQAIAKAEELRDKNPSYNPALDPNLNNPLSGNLSLDAIVKQLESVPAVAWIALAAFLLYLRFGHKEPAK